MRLSRNTCSSTTRLWGKSGSWRSATASFPANCGSVSVVFRISEVEDRIEEQREEMAKAVLNVMDLIDVLPANSTERTVVEMRHIDCRGWDKIAEALYMSRSNVFNYYNAAMDKILENKRNRKLLEEYMARKQQRAGPHGRNNRP